MNTSTFTLSSPGPPPPPPPPPAPAAAPAATSGWENEDDDLVDITHDDDEAPQVSLSVPPPPPPLQMPLSPLSDPERSRETTISSAAPDYSVGAVEDGWADEEALDDVLDDDMINQDLNDGNTTNDEDADDDVEGNIKNLVDHVPPPPDSGRESLTVDATFPQYDGEDDDDISRDDTLPTQPSMANSLRYQQHQLRLPSTIPSVAAAAAGAGADGPQQKRQQQQVATTMVDMTPPTPPLADATIPLKGDRDVVEDQGSMAVLYEESALDAASIATDSLSLRTGDSTTGNGMHAVNIVIGMTNDESTASGGGSSGINSNNNNKRLKPRRMVDMTPRLTRGTSGDVSMAVAGHTSVGESLDSIEEEDDEDEEVVGPTLTAVGASARGAAHSMPVLAPHGEDDTGEDTGLIPLVDHTPAAGRRSLASVAASMDVLSAFSEEGDLGESDVGVDDIKEDLYGPMVDHLPTTPSLESSGGIAGTNVDGNGEASSSNNPPIGEDDSTVRGHAEKTDVDYDFQQDETMEEDYAEGGEESSRGETSTLGMGTMGEDNRSLLSGRLPVVDETQHLVDHVPAGQLRGGLTGNSTMVFMDASTASVDNTVDDDGPGTDVGFGPIVDQIPKVGNKGASRMQTSAATSVITQVSGLAADIKEDDEMDNTVGPTGGTVNAGDDVELDDLQDLGMEVNDHIVDHVPKRRGQRVTLDASVRVLMDKDDDFTQGDTVAEDAVIVDFGPIVDTTPYGAPRTGLSVAASMMTQANERDGDALHSKEDDDFDNTTVLGERSDGGLGWDNDDPDLEDLSVAGGGVSTGPSTIASVDRPQRFEGNEDNLVDHVPRRSFSRPADASTMVLIDPLDAVSEVDDNDDDTAGNARIDKFGPVVDQTPALPSLPVSVAATSMRTQDAGNNVQEDDDMDGTWFGASTVGGISTVGASSAAAGGSTGAGDDDSGTGWDDDAQTVEELGYSTTQRSVPIAEQHLVDHVPSVASAPRADTNASMAVLADPSVVSSQAQEDNAQDERTDEGLYGAVVDHTPSVAAVSRRSGANSLVTLVTGLATDIKRDEDMDETTWQGGVSAQGEGWDQDDAELEELANNDDVDELPHLVDHVPERPGSRPVDPSLAVAAEPSEMSSQVDDLNQDEQNFGPVVDLTPIEPAIPPPAVGSTVVEIRSMLPDDLDDDVDPDEQERQVPNEWEDQLPNPQSGNDDGSSREPVVDFLPPQEQDFPDLVRDASSEMAIVDQQSTLPADEPPEAEYGLVVDTLPPTVARIPGQPAEEAVDAEDAKPPARQSRNVDSVALNFSVASKEKEDGLDDHEFGPVVDQLPPGSSRASLGALSRGGSTVDALATVSEVEDDLNTRDGWDEDTIDLPDQTSVAASHRTGDERNYSVTWVDSVTKMSVTTTTTASAPVGNRVNNVSGNVDSNSFFDAEMGETTRQTLDETKYYDPNETANNGWADDSLTFDVGENFADDDTPPSTPRPSISFKSDTATECATCASATSTDCPCVKAILDLNDGKETMVGQLQTKEGNFVKVDFQKLLQKEATKRVLLEKEHQALQDTIDSLKSSRDSLAKTVESHVAREKELMSAVGSWQTENGKLTEDYESMEKEISQIKGEKAQIAAKESQLVEEVNHLKASLDKMGKEAASDATIQQEIASLRSQMAAKEAECAVLNAKLNGLQEKLKKSEADNFKHIKEVARLSKEHTQALSGQQQRLAEYKQEIEHARRTHEQVVAESQQAASTNAAVANQLREENRSLQAQRSDLQSQLDRQSREQQIALRQKDAAIRTLEMQLQVVREEKTKLESEMAPLRKQTQHLSSVSTELQSVARERDVLNEALVDSKTDVADLQKQIDDLNRDWGSKYARRGDEIQALNEEWQNCLHEVETARNQVADLAERLENAESHRYDQQVRLEDLLRKQELVRSAPTGATNDDEKDAQLRNLEIEFEELNGQLESAKITLNNTETERMRLANRCAELESEMQRLSAYTSQTESLQADLQSWQVQDQSQKERIRALEDHLDKSENLVATQESKIANLQQEHDDVRAGFEDAHNEREKLLTKLESMEEQLLHFESEHRNLSDVTESKNTIVSNLNAELQKVKEERDAFRDQSSALNEENEEMLVQFGLLKADMDANDQEVERMESELQLRSEELSEAQRRLAATEEQLQTMMNQTSNGDEALRDQLVADNTSLRSQVQELSTQIQNMSSQLKSMESDNSSLIGTVEELRVQVEDLLATGDAKERQLQSTIAELQAENNELLGVSDQQSADISALHQKLQILEATTEEAASLRHQVADLESRLADQDRLLQQKDGELQDVQFQVQNAGRSPPNSSEMEALRRTIDELEDNTSHDKHQLQEIKILYDNVQQRLVQTEERLQAAHGATEQLRREMDLASQQAETQNQSLEERLRQLGQELESTRDDESRHRNDAAGLRQQLALLGTELRDARTRYEQPGSEPSGQGSAEIEALRLQIAALQRDQRASSSQTGAREELIEREVHELQDQMRVKDEQLFKMQQQIQSLGQDLSESHQELACKEEDMLKLSSEVEDLRAQAQLAASLVPSPTASRVLEHTRDEAENVDQMRADIVALAQALERSETSRAELIERIERERETNAESLRRLTDSVKRFYSTLNFGEN